MMQTRFQKRKLLQGAECKDKTYTALTNQDKSSGGEVVDTGIGIGVATEFEAKDSNAEEKLDEDVADGDDADVDHTNYETEGKATAAPPDKSTAAPAGAKQNFDSIWCYPSMPNKISFIVACPVEGCHDPVVLGRGRKLYSLKGNDDLHSFASLCHKRLSSGLDKNGGAEQLLPRAPEILLQKLKPKQVGVREKKARVSRKERYAVPSDDEVPMGTDTEMVSSHTLLAQPSKAGWLDLVLLPRFHTYCQKMRMHYKTFHMGHKLPSGCKAESLTRMRTNVDMWNTSHPDRQIKISVFQQTYNDVCSEQLLDEMKYFILDDMQKDNLWQRIIEDHDEKAKKEVVDGH
ncbi:unnamed protein product [Cylindrotheca closterium]|uniref:Uncharacterized protein n=1 Tax=Cylindrotheca closterium TaxID=2856 RepID=A0AAD2CSD1_9STRA|nr:unnamed protein product [Cylindrotheca closterium]